MMLVGCVVAAAMTMAVAQDRPQVYAPGNGVSLRFR
jgi:hypothetical protein